MSEAVHVALVVVDVAFVVVGVVVSVLFFVAADASRPTDEHPRIR